MANLYLKSTKVKEMVLPRARGFWASHLKDLNDHFGVTRSPVRRNHFNSACCIILLKLIF